LIYSGVVVVGDENMLICPMNINNTGNPNILIWEPNSYLGLVDKFGPQDGLYKIDDVTEMTVSEFFDLYSKNSSRCIHMPIEFSSS
jgi:hypothetical protein